MTETLHGWQCPRCKRVYAPATPECASCNNTLSILRTFGWQEPLSVRVTGYQAGYVGPPKEHDPKATGKEHETVLGVDIDRCPSCNRAVAAGTTCQRCYGSKGSWDELP